jgi:hypothetical protein
MLPMSEVTRVLSAIEQGDPHAADQLLPLNSGEFSNRPLRDDQPAHAYVLSPFFAA